MADSNVNCITNYSATNLQLIKKIAVGCLDSDHAEYVVAIDFFL